MRREIVAVPVGLGTPRGYELNCPRCGQANTTADAGTLGHVTVDGQEWYFFDCRCGCRYKAPQVPMNVPVRSLSDFLGGGR